MRAKTLKTIDENFCFESSKLKKSFCINDARFNIERSNSEVRALSNCCNRRQVRARAKEFFGQLSLQIFDPKQRHTRNFERYESSQTANWLREEKGARLHAAFLLMRLLAHLLARVSRRRHAKANLLRSAPTCLLVANRLMTAATRCVRTRKLRASTRDDSR